MALSAHRIAVNCLHEAIVDRKRTQFWVLILRRISVRARGAGTETGCIEAVPEDKVKAISLQPQPVPDHHEQGRYESPASN
jgi:hypothetical protein